MAHSSPNYMKNYLGQRRLKAKFAKSLAFVKWYQDYKNNKKVMLEMLERTIKVAVFVPKFRRDYEIMSPLEAKEKIDLEGWKKILLQRNFVIGDDELNRYSILDDATEKVVSLEMELAAKYKINPLYILADINICLEGDQKSGKVYEEIAVSPEIYLEFSEGKIQ